MRSQGVTKDLMMVVMVTSLLLFYMVSAKGNWNKNAHYKIHKYFQNDEDSMDSWDSFRGVKQVRYDDSFASFAVDARHLEEDPAVESTGTGKDEERDEPPSDVKSKEKTEKSVEKFSLEDKDKKKMKSAVKEEHSETEKDKDTEEHEDKKQTKHYRQTDKKKYHSSTQASRDTDRKHFETPRDSEVKQKTTHAPMKDRCSGIRCRLGRTCQTDEGGRARCMCAGPEHCHPEHQGDPKHLHHHEVCGSNGKTYPSHCEMHRQACLTGQRIRAGSDLSTCQPQAETLDGDVKSQKPKSNLKNVPITEGQTELDDKIRDNDLLHPDKMATSTQKLEPLEVKKPEEEEDVKVFKTTVVAGSGLEIKCDVNDDDITSPAVWRRNGHLLTDLVSSDMQVFADGSLYFSQVDLYHIGNYSCNRLGKANPTQTHTLSVTVPPVVHVNPTSQVHVVGATVSVECLAVSLPAPSITWLVGEGRPVPSDGQHLVLEGGHTLQIQSVDWSMNGTKVTCKADNSAGSGSGSAQIFIRDLHKNSHQQAASSTEEYYVVFSADGYTIYEPNYCHIVHVVTADYVLSQTYAGRQTAVLCEEKGACVWGQAALVANKFVYVAQPTLNRVIVIELADRFNPIEVIEMNDSPRELTYISHLDQLWVTCHEEGRHSVQGQSHLSQGHLSQGHVTSLIIRQTSVEMKHQTVHIQPSSEWKDALTKVRKVFLPPSLDLDVKMNYGYLAVSDEMALYKIDLESLTFVKRVELDCLPESLTIVPIGGKVFIRCAKPETGREGRGEEDKEGDEGEESVMLDYVTDNLEHSDDVIQGTVHVTPDSRQLLSVTHNTVSVYKVHETGQLDHVYTHSVDISDSTAALRFVQSTAATSSESNYNVFIRDTKLMQLIDITAGHIYKIDGITDLMKGEGQTSDRLPRTYHVAHSGLFGKHVMTSSSNSVVIIDARRRHVQCQWPDMRGISAIVGVRLG